MRTTTQTPNPYCYQIDDSLFSTFEEAKEYLKELQKECPELDESYIHPIYKVTAYVIATRLPQYTLRYREYSRFGGLKFNRNDIYDNEQAAKKTLMSEFWNWTEAQRLSDYTAAAIKSYLPTELHEGFVGNKPLSPEAKAFIGELPDDVNYTEFEAIITPKVKELTESQAVELFRSMNGGDGGWFQEPGYYDNSTLCIYESDLKQDKLIYNNDGRTIQVFELEFFYNPGTDEYFYTWDDLDNGSAI